MLTRRAFVAGLGAAITALHSSGLTGLPSGTASAAALPPVDDTFNALLAFVVPGNDPFSVAQGVTDPLPGGVDAGVLEALIETLDLAASIPGPLTVSQFVALTLAQVADGVNPAAGGFAGLLSGEKQFVFEILEGNPEAAPLASALLTLTANLVYSEAGVFDSGTRTLTAQPLGWNLTGYPGASDGRDEFVGYYRGQRSAS